MVSIFYLFCLLHFFVYLLPTFTSNACPFYNRFLFIISRHKWGYRCWFTVCIQCNIDYVAVGDVVSVQCEMRYVGRTSMEVGVEVMAEDIITGEVRHIASSYVIYVALGANRKPTPVPPLVPADDEEKSIIEQASNRRLRLQKIDEEMKQTKDGKE